MNILFEIDSNRMFSTQEYTSSPNYCCKMIYFTLKKTQKGHTQAICIYCITFSVFLNVYILKYVSVSKTTSV